MAPGLSAGLSLPATPGPALRPTVLRESGGPCRGKRAGGSGGAPGRVGGWPAPARRGAPVQQKGLKFRAGEGTLLRKSGEAFLKDVLGPEREKGFVFW